MSPRASIIALLLAPVGVYVFACAMLFATQRNLLYFPVARHNLELPSEMLAVPGGPVQVSVRARDGAKAVVYFGGNAEDVSLTVPELAVTFPDRSVYALHYRGYGSSPGSPNERDNVADALALFDRVHAAHADVVVIGRSLGSGVAVQVAGQRPASRLVLVTPYDAMAEVAAAHYPYFPVRWLLRDHYDSAAIAPGIAVPTTLIAGDQDATIPLASTQRLFAAFKPGVARLVVVPGDHESLVGAPGYFPALQGAP